MNKAWTYLLALVLLLEGGGVLALEAPARLKVKATASDRVILRWFDGSAHESGFVVERQTGSGSWRELLRTDPGVDAVAVGGLEPDADYVFRVKSFVDKKPGTLFSAPSAEASVSTFPEGGVPSAVDNSVLSAFPPVGEQEDGSCVAWAVGYYSYTFELASQRGWNAAGGDKGRILSPSWLYNIIASKDDDHGLGGSWDFFAHRVLKTHGAVTWDAFETKSGDHAWSLDAGVWRSALDRRAAAARRIDNPDTPAGLLRLKEALAAGHCPSFPTIIHKWLSKPASDDPQTNVDDPHVGGQVAYDRGPGGEPHCMTVVGYNDQLWLDLDGDGVVDPGEKGALKVVNSQGKDWMDGGFCWVLYSSLGKLLKSKIMFYCVPLGSAADGGYQPKLVAQLQLRTNARDSLIVRAWPEGASGDDDSPDALDVYFNLPSSGTYCFDGQTHVDAYRTAPSLTLPVDLTSIMGAAGEDRKYHFSVKVVGSPDAGNREKAFCETVSLRFTEPTQSANLLDAPVTAWEGEGRVKFSGNYKYPLDPPKAVINAFSTHVRPGKTLRFDTLGTEDNSGPGHCLYAWDYGDGVVVNGGRTGSHVYEKEGVYAASVTVTDPDGFTDVATVAIHVDSTAPRLQDVQTLARGMLKLRFSEDIDPKGAADPGLYSVKGASVLNASVPEDEPAAVVLAVDGVPRRGRYQLSARGVPDLSGNLSAKQTLAFTYSPPFSKAGNAKARQRLSARPLPRIVATPVEITMAEGSEATFKVRLSGNPGQARSLYATPGEGALLRVVDGARLVFDESNWSQSQTITIAVDSDQDGDDSFGTVNVRGAGLDPLELPVTALDHDDISRPALERVHPLSSTVLEVVFDKPLMESTAVDKAHYAISGGVNILAAKLLDDRKTVSLTLDRLRGGVYFLSVKDVRDSVGNRVADGVRREFAFASLAPELQLHLAFDEAGQTGVALDCSGKGRHGQVGADVEVNHAGKAGRAYRFKGLNLAMPNPYQVVAVPMPEDVCYDSLSVAFWYKADKASGYLFSWGDSDSGCNFMDLYLLKNKGISFRLRDHDDSADSPLWRFKPSDFEDGRWHHFALSKDADGVRLYFDGKPVPGNLGDAGREAFIPEKELFIGGDDNAGYCVSALVDEFQVYSMALSQAEVTRLAGSRPLASRFVPTVRKDFDGDGFSDILSWNARNGALNLDLMDGRRITKRQQFFTTGDNAWVVAASADFNADHKADLLLRNTTTGALCVLLMSGHGVVGRGTLWAGGDSDWKFAATGDLNGDGRQDVVVRHAATGAVYAYLLDGVNVTDEGFATLGGGGWAFSQLGDISGDGKADILLRHAASGAVHAFLMDGVGVKADGCLWRGGAPAWRLDCLADLNGDKRQDLLFVNHKTGTIHAFLMDGLGVLEEGQLCEGVKGWDIVAHADFNGDGKDDLLLYDQLKGSAFLLVMDGLAAADDGFLWDENENVKWTVADTGDYDGDGRDDILITHPDGRRYLYLMDGVEVVSEGVVHGMTVDWRVK